MRPYGAYGPTSVTLEGVVAAGGNVTETMTVYGEVITEVDQSLASRAWNELFERPGVPPDLYAPLFAQLALLQPTELRLRAEQLSRTFRDRGVAVERQRHAWVKYFCGSWVGIDPTNGLHKTERHVIVAKGRDYDNVAPLKGVYEGPLPSMLGVVVEMVAHTPDEREN